VQRETILWIGHRHGKSRGAREETNVSEPCGPHRRRCDGDWASMWPRLSGAVGSGRRFARYAQKLKTGGRQFVALSQKALAHRPVFLCAVGERLWASRWVRRTAGPQVSGLVVAEFETATATRRCRIRWKAVEASPLFKTADRFLICAGTFFANSCIGRDER